MTKYIKFILFFMLTALNYTYSQRGIGIGGAEEILDPGDNGGIPTTTFVWYRDLDADGYGNKYVLTSTATNVAPLGFVSNKDDCNDNDPNVTIPIKWYPDRDGDGYGTRVGGGVDVIIDPTDPFIDPNGADTTTDDFVLSCTQPVGYANNRNDCDDNNPNINVFTWYMDADQDGFGDPAISTTSIVHGICVPPYQFVANNLDCDDSDFNLNPNTSWYLDTNEDGVYDVGIDSFFQGCSPPTLDYLVLDTNLNWTHAVSYDVFGNISGIARTYFDDLGKSNVSVTKDVMRNTTWRSEIVYDSFGRPYKSSFPAVSPNDFQKIDVLSDPVAKSTYLDYFYSDANTLNPFQATATHPFSETEYDKLNPGNVIRSYGGNKIGGDWKTGYSFTIPAAQEMYYVFGHEYYNGSVTVEGEEVITKFYKSVNIDPHGVETVGFTDGEGKTLAVARSTGSTVSYPVISTIGTQGFVDVYIPAGTTAGTFIGASSLYKVYNLKTGLLITPTPATLAPGNAYRVEAVTIPSIDYKTFINQSTGVITAQAGALGVQYRVNYYDFSLNYYDKTGRLNKTIQPNGFDVTTINTGKVKATPNHTYATTYKYNALGQLIETTSPDEGTSKFAYRNDGQIRFSQSAIQVAQNKISYTNYDTYGRPIESGVIIGYAWNDAIANVNNALPVASSLITYSEQTLSMYDFEGNITSGSIAPPTLSNVLFANGYNPANYLQHNLDGNVVTSLNNQSQSWYSYDLYGRVEWMVQKIQGLGVKTVHYEYDAKGQVKKVIYQKDKASELFVHQYTYDFNGALESVSTSTNNLIFTKQADYEYYIDGKLKRVVLAEGIQGTDYVYTLGGMLKSINHPSLEASKDPGGDNNDIFGITLDYYTGDYIRPSKPQFASAPTVPGVNQDNYDGNIKASRFAMKSTSMDFNGVAVMPKAYAYTYNNNKFLANATFGILSASNVIQPQARYREGGLQYDANGNIRNLQRTDQNGTLVDNFTYNYKPGTNQLTSVSDATAAGLSTVDIDSQPANNYVYNAIGQLTRNNQEGLDYFYNTQGLVTEVRKNAYPVVKFYYNERGERVRKEKFTPDGESNGNDYYVLDASGNTLANYTNSVLKELPVYGGSRLGVYNKSGNFTNYQITDHLGNVRAVIRKNGTSAAPLLQQYADYYPFGEQLPARNSFGGYLYAYQGQELDPETGMEAFKLRLWDGRIGRWLSPDPYGQYHSPYLGMGNNPLSSIDPDGGFEWEWYAKFINILVGGDGVGYNEQRKEYYVKKSTPIYEKKTLVYEGKEYEYMEQGMSFTAIYNNPEFYIEGSGGFSLGPQLGVNVNVLGAEVGLSGHYNRVKQDFGFGVSNKKFFYSTTSELNSYDNMSSGYSVGFLAIGGAAEYYPSSGDYVPSAYKGQMKSESISIPLYGTYERGYDTSGVLNENTTNKHSWDIGTEVKAGLIGVHYNISIGYKY